MAERSVSRKQFIRLSGALSVGVAGASMLTACGGETSGQGSGGQTTTAGSGGTGSGGASGQTQSGGGTTQAAREVGPGETVAQASAVPTNSAEAFVDAETGQPAVLVHLPDGAFVAYSAICTHQGCPVAYEPESSNLVCPCHGSVFNPAQSGAVVNPPAEQPLPDIPVEERNGEIVRI